MVGQHMPASAAQPHQVDGVVGEMARRRPAVHDLARPEEVPVGVDQHRRHQVLREQRLRTVEIGQDGIEQAGTLNDTGLELGPFVGRHHEGQRIECPARRAAIVQQIDRRARLLELATRAFHALAQPAGQRADDA